jgi:outer membrane protein
MKYFFRLLVGIIFIVCFQHYAWGQDSFKIGVVDMQKFQEGSKSFHKIREELRQKFESLQQKLDVEKNELLKIEEEFKKQSMMLSLDAKEDKQKELEKKSRHYKYLYEEYTQEMKAAELEVRKKVGKELEKVVEKIGQREGYLIILEKRTIGLIYYADAMDMTEQVIKAYDQMSK